MVLGNRLIDIRSFWRLTIQIVKIAIRFSTISLPCKSVTRNLQCYAISFAAYCVIVY